MFWSTNWIDDAHLAVNSTGFHQMKVDAEKVTGNKINIFSPCESIEVDLSRMFIEQVQKGNQTMISSLLELAYGGIADLTERYKLHTDSCQKCHNFRMFMVPESLKEDEFHLIEEVWGPYLPGERFFCEDFRNNIENGLRLIANHDKATEDPMVRKLFHHHQRMTSCYQCNLLAIKRFSELNELFQH